MQSKRKPAFRLEIRSRVAEISFNPGYTFAAQESCGGQTETGGPNDHTMAACTVPPDVK